MCFSPGDGGMVLWGNMLHGTCDCATREKFDRFSDGGGACFHPTGNSVILNSEVLGFTTGGSCCGACPPLLDGTQLSWTRAGDVALASFGSQRMSR